MARTLNPQAHAAKRDSILDTVEQLIATKGYANLTIPDLIAAAGMSKGAFYHYYPAKADVLEALLDRRLDRWQDIIEPIAKSETPATDRMLKILRTLGVVKLQDRDFLIDSLRSLYADENALVHHRTRIGAARRFTPIIGQVVEAGVQAGEFRAHDPFGATRVVISLLQDCADYIGKTLLEMSEGRAGRDTLASISSAYVEAIHDAIGAVSGTIAFIEDRDLSDWAAAAFASTSRAPEEAPK